MKSAPKPTNVSQPGRKPGVVMAAKVVSLNIFLPVNSGFRIAPARRLLEGSERSLIRSPTVDRSNPLIALATSCGTAHISRLPSR